MCKVKLCQNISETNFGQKNEHNKQYAIKRFNKLTLRKNKQYLRRPDGQGMTVWTQLDAVKKEIDIMKNIRNQNCIQLYEVIQDTDEDDDDASDKIYMILELAKYKEIMTWNSNSYDFVPNPILLLNSED